MFFNNPIANFAQPIVAAGGFSKNIVTSGLIMYVDAGVAASNQGGSTWYDLSGNGYNWTLNNGAAFAGAGATAYVNFDGTNDFARVTNSTIAQIGSLAACTYQLTVFPTARNEEDVFSTDGIGGAGTILLMIYQDSKIRNHYWTAGGIGAPDNTNGGNVPLSTTQGIGGGWNMATPLVYSWRTAPSGFSAVSVTPSGTQPTSTSTALNLGSRDGTGAYYNGRINNVVIYNRLLNDTELQQNFTALTP
jgi:hypothetical protein